MDDNSWQKLLTIAWCISIGASEALGTGHPLPHAVAHVAGGGGLEPVDHELGAVPHRDVQLAHAALPVLVDARRAGHDPLRHARHGACNQKQ